MASRYRRFTKVFFLLLNIIAVIGFILACIAPYLDPEKWWMISIVGLGFVFLIVTLIAFIFFWLIFKPKFALISLLTMIIGWKSISVFFAFHIPKKFDYKKPDNILRLAHWNVARFIELKRNNNAGSQTRLLMMDLIRKQEADVLCLSEFYTSTDPEYYNNLNHMMNELGYPYFYYSWDSDGHLQWTGQAIFSRYPIINSNMIRFPKPGLPEALVYSDIVFNKDTIRVFTTHLQSTQFKKQDYDRIERIKNPDESLVENSKNIFSKLKRAFVYRSRQAKIVKEITSQSPYSYILTGDLNDVPNSYTYFTIKGETLQ
ncbi:MAG: endonuclease/exonuclease/phosphatase family protein, partial [Flavisolibacter sp.]